MKTVRPPLTPFNLIAPGTELNDAPPIVAIIGALELLPLWNTTESDGNIFNRSKKKVTLSAHGLINIPEQVPT
jgi:hypothetical protein